MQVCLSLSVCLPAYLSVRSVCLALHRYEGSPFLSLGADGVNKASKERGKDIVAFEGSMVHSKCQLRYTDKKDIRKNKSSDFGEASCSRKSARLSTENSKRANLLCLFCDQPIHFETSRDGRKSDASKVHTHDFVKAITNCAAQRCDEKVV